ncbi:MAG TPA: sigma-54 dependent transcriptional regulator [Planctomycetota bacterium]|nr:sigma-54 dependent transcriptional regulator [Planctomycetota bacterium]
MPERPPLILVVDDADDVRATLEMCLRYEGFAVETAAEATIALGILEQAPVDLVLLDVKMPGMDGLEALSRIRARWPGIAVLMISGHGDVRTAVDAVKQGAEDFLEKPLEADRVAVAVRNALRRRSLERENRTLREQLDRSLRWVGTSATCTKLLEVAERAAASEERILIVGETGTGKELLARRIHAASRRREGPLEVLPCSAISPELVEDELFGHEAGAFTGAHSRRAGAFERAAGGTLLIDEVGEMPLDVQAKCLRVLESGTFTRLGGERPVRSDARVIATTHHDLRAEAEAGRFRSDLYYRLGVVVLTIPPLRERTEDVVPLAREFLVEAARRARVPGKRLSSNAEAALAARHWPGNVRELRNAVGALATLAEAPTITAEDVHSFFAARDREAPRDPFEAETLEEFRRFAERLYLERRIASLGGNLKRTAEALRISRSNLYKTLERVGLKAPPHRGDTPPPEKPPAE